MNELVPLGFEVPEGGLSTEGLRVRVQQLEDAMFAAPEVQVQVPVVSRFARGLYAREVTLPEGIVATGKIHKYEHLVFITKGDISVLTEKGVVRMKAPCTFVSPPGTKRAVYCHEETVFTTVHATDFKTPEECEANLVTDTFDKYFAFVEAQKLLEEKKECPT